MEGKAMKGKSVFNDAEGYIRSAFFGIALLLTAQGSVLASNSSSVLKLSAWNNETFEATLNGKVYRSESDLRINPIASGLYQLKVVQRSRNAYGYGGGKVTTIFNGTICIPKNSRMNVIVDRNRQLRFISVEPLRPAAHRPNNPRPRPIAQPRPGNGNGNNNDVSCDYNDHDGWANNHDFEPVWEYEDEDEYNTDYVYNSTAVIDHEEFEDILRRMQDAWFEEDRMILARQAIGDRLVQSEQVLQMLESFNFDSTRLEFAKFAYHHAADPGRYYVVNEAFNFSSSIRELDEYLASVI